jgi:glycosyltransferase involved in cell wall biosynthesis
MSKDVGKIFYLSGAIEPHREGISKEVFALHNHFKESFVLGTSPDGGFMHSQSRRYCGIPAKLLPTIRYWLRFVARDFQLIHIVHGIDCYHYLKVRRSTPVILTAISVDHILSMNHYEKVQTIVVESARDRQRLVAHGFDPEKVVVIYPGSDLSLFNDKVPPPDGPFKILFASSPFSSEYMVPRGVRLLLEVAKIKTDVEFILLWRKRGDTLSTLRQWISDMALTNVTVIHEDIADINRIFCECHATIVPFTSEKNTKSCPNSAIESLATGRPVLVSDKVGIADVVQKESCGVVFSADTGSVVESIEKMQQGYNAYRKSARTCANTCFDEKVFLASYEKLYTSILLQNRGSA